jgi:(1->4)-alpha-D-glucan 1-alpha-D-glucosylmutase
MSQAGIPAAISHVPRSTYRLQFGPHLSLSEATSLVGYFHDLGITTVYSSPLFRARRDSAHGYDVIDHNKIDPELGTEADLQALAEELTHHGLGLLMDVVPNHMGIDDPNNVLWQDVLENGQSSSYAKFFDIDWNPPKAELQGKVLVPVLGDQYGKVLENRELSIAYEDQRFYVRYYQRRYPLAPESWPLVLRPALEEHLAWLAGDDPIRMELESIVASLERLPKAADQNQRRIHERRREESVARRRLTALWQSGDPIHEAVEASLADLNGSKGDPHSFDRLESLLAQQHYRLCFWRVAADEINYRRFFDINDLAALRVEDPDVFRAVHAMVFRFLERGWVTGLRIDHPDGLLDPEHYLQDLQAGYRELQVRHPLPTVDGDRPLYIVVEKILGYDESLRSTWPTHGTTGYDFLNLLNGIFVDRRSARRIKEIYSSFTGDEARFFNLYYDSKKAVLKVSMSSELSMLARRLDRISEQHRWSRDFTLASLRTVLMEVVACFPVYRSYIQADAQTVGDEDRRQITLAIRAAARRNPGISKSVFDFLKSLLLLEDPDGLSPEQVRERREFVLRFQQFTGPVTAKGLEDTAFYRTYPLVSLNEVGGEPGHFGVSLEEFHRHLAEQAEHWPWSMLATSTHDTKRSEDVRARINVLSEIPEEWAQALERWHGMNGCFKSQIEGSEAPDNNEEYLFYQSLVGTWPVAALDDEQHTTYVDRLVAYMLKATREAKVHNSWMSPDEEYDAAVERFVRASLSRESEHGFAKDFAAFRSRIALAGMLNALAQVLVKVCSPGVCDFYQGTELWDYSLVDPDNRHAIDFALHRRLLAELAGEIEADLPGLLTRLSHDWPDGRIKLFVTRQALHLRRAQPELFLDGRYIPLNASGPAADHVCAFARQRGEQWALCIVPRYTFSLAAKAEPGISIWADTSIVLPEGAPLRWTQLLSRGPIQVDPAESGVGPRLLLEDVFREFPLAILVSTD